MKVVTTRAELRRVVTVAPFDALPLVPTMGYLHEGHLSLVRQAKAERGHVAASIFVNPKQFGPAEDLATYPRDLDRDLALLEAEGCDLVWIDVGSVTEVLEGASRPGHFRGVATVVNVLLNAMQPDSVYVGQKDAQQCVVLRKMVSDLGMPVEVVVCPTVRERDGLAMSSRNAYLLGSDREAAGVLIRALHAADAAWRSGEASGDSLRQEMLRVLDAEPRAAVDYVSVADVDTLTELDHVAPGRGALASLAVRVGPPRLIDNLVLAPRS